MEKYHDWRDAFTGIHPFLPASGVKAGAFVVLGLIRLLIVLVALFFVVLVDALLPMLRGSIGVLLTRALLLLGGIWPSLTRRGSPSQKTTNVFFVNRKSYVDLLCAAALVGPSHYCFVFGDVMTVHRSLLSAFLFVVNRHAPSSEANVPLSELKKLPRAVCFPEGASSNHEKCLLALDDEFASSVDKMGLNYEFLHLSYPSKATAFLGIEGSFIRHLLFVLSVPWQTVRVVSMASDPSGFEASWEKLSLVSGYKRLKLDWQDKNEFLEKWNSK
jgi:hypothetical protein